MPMEIITRHRRGLVDVLLKDVDDVSKTRRGNCGKETPEFVDDEGDPELNDQNQDDEVLPEEDEDEEIKCL